MLTLQFIPYTEIEKLNSEDRIQRLLQNVKKNKVVLMQGRLRPVEETTLIQKTMEQVSKSFKGIELCTIHPEQQKDKKFFEIMKAMFVKMLVGSREGFTIIGPASVVKEIRKNPDKVELLTQNIRKSNGSRRK